MPADLILDCRFEDCLTAGLQRSPGQPIGSLTNHCISSFTISTIQQSSNLAIQNQAIQNQAIQNQAIQNQAIKQ
jgi:hypothetical protein